MQKYKAKSGKTQFMPSFEEIEEIVQGDNMGGFCLACGQPADNVEPDARKYHCEHCAEMKVYGAEQLLLMGLHH